jgi:hypothetical protein
LTVSVADLPNVAENTFVINVAQTASLGENFLKLTKHSGKDVNVAFSHFFLFFFNFLPAQIS